MFEDTQDEMIAAAEFMAAQERMIAEALIEEMMEQGATEREIAVVLFMHEHENELIHETQEECLAYLWSGRKLH